MANASLSSSLIASYVVTVGAVNGSGSLSLTLNASHTNIVDLTGNPIIGGFAGGTAFLAEPAVPVPALSGAMQLLLGFGLCGRALVALRRRKKDTTLR